MNEAAISTRQLSKAFDKVKAVDAVDLTVQKNTIFGLVGPDGAGKTTLIRLLCTVIGKTSGSATVLGLDIDKDAEQVRDRIGYMSQLFSQYLDLSVEENINFRAELYGVDAREMEKRKNELLEFTRLTPFRQRLAAQLSGGMKQKLALAATLIHRPHLLFLDEPTTGVDPLSRRDFWKILNQIPDITIFVTTPYMDEAEKCHTIALMHRGKIQAVDTPDNIKRSTGSNSVEDAFFKIIESKGYE
ncbi:MAG: ABC transporter ATP-binding protein [Candidatus Margulisbacteria bacterium]|nr:ABC transporter ATP-binding protein [Candidatus Margulisiibacteriota bacterium]